MSIELRSTKPVETFTALENIRMLSQTGFKRFDIVDTKDGRRIKMRKGGVIKRPLPDVLHDVKAMYNEGRRAKVVLTNGTEKSYDEWLKQVAASEHGIQALQDLRSQVMTQPLSNYLIYSGDPRYPELLAEIDTQEAALKAMNEEALKGPAMEAQMVRDNFLGNPKKAVNVTDITALTELSQEDLKRIYDANMGPFDLETTGLNAEKNAISEVSALRVIKGADGDYHVLHFHAFCSPERPEYEEYLQAKKSGNPIPYDRKKYEYEVSLDALGVTDTKFVRPDPNGPITKMVVSGDTVPCQPFYKVREQYEAFRQGIDQTAYNAPYDNPFQRKKMEHIDAYHEKAGKSEPEAPAHDAAASATNPAHYICQMLLTMRQIGQWPANNLDNAYRTLVDHGFKGRGSHLGFEDNVMLIRITSALLKQYGKSMSVADIYRDVTHGVDKDATITADEQGNITLTFSKDPASISENAKKFWEFFRDLNEAKLRSPRIPKNITSLIENGEQRAPKDEKNPAPAGETGQYSVTLSAERTNPLIFSLLRKFMMYDDVLDKQVVDKVAFFDSTSRTDVSLPATASSNGPTEEDVPLGSLRLNYQYLATHLQDLQTNVQMIKTISSMKNVGLVTLADDKIEIRSFQRNFGKVIFTVPPGTKPADHLEKITESIRFLSSIGGIPGVVSATEQWQEEEPAEAAAHDDDKKQIAGVIETRISAQNPDHITMELSPALAQCLLHARQNLWPDGIKATTNKDKTVTLEGDKADFHAFQHTIKDMSWLLHRIRRLPGTHNFTLREDGTVILHQDWGTAIEATQILEQAQIPFTAKKKEIMIHIDGLMREAYRYSGAIEEATAELKANEDKSEKNRLPPPAHLADLKTELWNDRVDALHLDGRDRIWAMVAGQSHELKAAPNGHVALQYDEKKRLIGPLSSTASLGSLHIVPAPSSYDITVNPDSKSMKALDDLWAEILPTEQSAGSSFSGGVIHLPGEIYANYRSTINRKRSLVIEEVKSNDLHVSGSPAMMDALWKMLEADGVAASCTRHDSYIVIDKDEFASYQQRLVPLGNTLRDIERIHADAYLPLQGAQLVDGQVVFDLQSIPSIQDLGYIHQLENILPKFSNLSAIIAKSSSELNADNDALYTARHGKPTDLLAHMESQLPTIEHIQQELSALLSERREEAGATSEQAPLYFSTLLQRLPTDERIFGAAASFLEEQQTATQNQTEGRPDNRIGRGLRTAQTLANTLSSSHHHLQKMTEQSAILSASINRTKQTMSELYIALAVTGDAAEKDELLAKAKALYDSTNPAIAVKGTAKQDEKWNKLVAGIEEEKENPYLVFQKHKAAIRAAFEGENNISDALENVRRHTNQSKGTLSFLSDMLSAAPGKGSFVRDDLPTMRSVTRERHIDAMIRGLCEKKVPFTLRKGQLLINRDELERLAQGQAPADVATPTPAFLSSLMAYMQNPDNDVSYDGKSITLTVDAGKGTSDRLSLPLEINQPMPREILLKLDQSQEELLSRA
ncbi:MAG: hypothetical protein SFT92_06830 [Rickettsiales bacterium]|nr:hypothetical protein [Rickettsiales bacterium]